MVFLVDWDKVQNFSNKMLVIGILCVAVAGPVLSYGLSTWPVVSQSTMTISESSSTNIRDAYSYTFTVTYDEQISAKIDCTYVNNSVIVKIFSKGVYDRECALNTDPDTLTGLTFYRSQAYTGTTPAYAAVTSFSAPSSGTYAFIDFGGNAGGNFPGTYVLIVYGDNSGPVTDTNVNFDIQITQEIFGRIWGRFVSTVGWCIIIVCGILSLALYIKKTMEARV
jgi:hypothetical protein